jgi:ketosteroid isomerase-like protein
MSPEQMLGKAVYFRSDIFAVGAVAYELLCYQRAFKGSIDSGLLVQLPYEDPPSLREVADGVPPELDQIVMKALQKAPENRFRDLAEMRAALLRVWETLEREATLQTVIIPRRDPGAGDKSGGPHSPSSRGISNDELGLRNQSRETVERHARESRAPASVTDDGKTQFKPRVGGQRRAYAIAAVVLVVTGLVGTAAWLMTRSDSELTSESTVGPNATVPSPTPVGVPNQVPLPSPATPTTVDPTRSDTTPVSSSPAVNRPASPATAPANTPVNTPVAAPPASPPRAAPSSSNAALESTVQDVLARVTTMYTGGELAAALDTLSRSQAVSSDSRVAALASRVANAAFDTMASAEKTAASRNAAEVAGDALRRGNDAKARAEAFQQRSDFVNAGLQALAAREFYQTAAADALAIRTQPTAPSAAAASPSASPAAAAPTLVQREQEGIVAAVGRFQAAYRDRDINALMKVYPSLRREARQKIEASFKTCRAYDVTFSDEQILIDPTNANIAQVTLRGTYACTVRTGQPPQVAESRDVFVLRKTGDIWIIERTGTIN